MLMRKPETPYSTVKVEKRQHVAITTLLIEYDGIYYHPITCFMTLTSLLYKNKQVSMKYERVSSSASCYIAFFYGLNGLRDYFEV